MAYNLLLPVHIISSGDMSSTITSSIVEVKNQDNVGIQMHWTGTPTGSFAFQISSDYSQDIQGNIINAGHWVTLPVSPAIAAAGAPDDAYVDLIQISALYVRIVYTASSGSGTLDAILVAKGV